MTAIPDTSNIIQSMIDAAHENQIDKPRSHLGPSQLGHPCDRWLWLSFRWAVRETFPGRILRLFRRGHNEESTMVSDLRAIGLDVRGTTGQQQRVNFGAHVSGSIDAIIESGVPSAPNKRHVAEFKTHSLKSFNDVEKNGVENSKPMHFAQMQLYMHGMEIDRALYLAVCKDDDRIYTERVRYDKDVAEKLVARGHRITLSDRMPEPISADPSWYQCKFCAAHSFCHEESLTKYANCRTCAHSTAQADSTWRCERHDADGIPVEFQREGCESHVLHPDLVPWKLNTDASTSTEAVWMIEGKPIRNGDPDKNVYSSNELVKNWKACVSGDDFISEVRAKMSGRIVG